MIRTKQGKELKADGTIEGNPSVLVDAVAVPEGEESLQTLMQDGKAKHYLCQAYRHLKAIALPSHARQLLQAAGLPDDAADAGLVTEDSTQKTMKQFLEAMKQHRVWDREEKAMKVPA